MRNAKYPSDLHKGHWDLYEHYKWLRENSPSVTDWEGFADPEEAQRLVDEVARDCLAHRLDMHTDQILEYAPMQMICDLVTHWVHTNMDQGDYTPSKDEIRGALWVLDQILECGKWVPSL